jgi:hypothetical protein
VTRFVAILLSLATGPLMILGMLLTIPVALVLMALGGVTLVSFLWSLVCAFIWLIDGDPNASRGFFQALGISCAAAAAMTSLMWGMSSLKDWLFSKPPGGPQEPQLTREQCVTCEPPANEIILLPQPANDRTRGR